MLNTIEQTTSSEIIPAMYEASDDVPDNIEKMLKGNLSPLPGSVFRILELLRDVNVSTSALATAVGQDPLLAARLLRLANSSYYSRQKNITTLPKAIDTIGMKALYDAVILGVAANTFSKQIEDSAVGRAVWEHSLAVALLSRELTDILEMRGAENAFICGLLHDIGKLILLKADPESFKRLSETNEDDEMIKAEEKVFGVNHTEIGTLLARRWNLPEEISAVILHHHDSANATHAVFMTHIVSVADIIADANGYGMWRANLTDYLENEEVKVLQSESVFALHLNQSQMFNAWENIKPDLQEIVNSFRGN